MSQQLQVRLACDYCNAVLITDPQKPSEEIGAWVRVIFNNQPFDFCTADHARQWLKNKSNVIQVAQ